MDDRLNVSCGRRLRLGKGLGGEENVCGADESVQSGGGEKEMAAEAGTATEPTKKGATVTGFRCGDLFPAHECAEGWPGTLFYRVTGWRLSIWKWGFARG